jgi:hypothetical protein
VIAADNVEDATVLALEVGFHAEYPQVADNEEVIAHLLGCEDCWRPVIDDEVVARPFLGRPDVWRRLSETWPEPDLSDADLALELAARLIDYVTSLELVRRDR